MENLKVKDIKNVFSSIKDIMIEKEDYLFDLDSKMGDGDLGNTMKNGFIEVNKILKDSSELDIGKIFIEAGKAMASSAPSTMGTLMSIGLMRAGNTIKGKIEINLQDISKIFITLVEGIMEQGKSKLGDRTIIDSMFPAANALKKAYDDGMDIPQAFMLAIKAAKEGLKSTKDMISVHGKAVYHTERSKGIEDPGAAAGFLFLKGFYNSIINK